MLYSKQQTLCIWCYVPSEHSGDEVPFPVPLSGNKTTLVAYIGADGSVLKPLIVIHRKTIDADIALTELADEKAAIYSQPKGFIDRPIFWAWFEAILIPEICQRCARYQYAGNIILLMVNCTTHMFLSLESLWTQHSITSCLLPPHGSNQTPLLDLSTFGIAKRLLPCVGKSSGEADGPRSRIFPSAFIRLTSSDCLCCSVSSLVCPMTLAPDCPSELIP
jgi:hypothetical protein